MAHDHFNEVYELDIETQHKLLEGGTPVEKLWAAWSLGLKSDETLHSQLLMEIREDPAPGLRSKFAIMLAGMGERSILEVLAAYDMDEFVRETACRYLLQAFDHDQQLQDFMVDRLFTDEAPLVRKLILLNAINDFPGLDRDHIEQLLVDKDDEIQAIAFDLVSQYDYGWVSEDLPVKAGIEIAKETFFDWLLWETGYRENPTTEAREKGYGITSEFSRRLAAITHKLPDNDAVSRSHWVIRMKKSDRQQVEVIRRKNALLSRMEELNQDQAIDFLTEIFVGWACRQENGSEIVMELGRIMYYAS
jgi:hypothetical protein